MNFNRVSKFARGATQASRAAGLQAAAVFKKTTSAARSAFNNSSARDVFFASNQRKNELKTSARTNMGKWMGGRYNPITSTPKRMTLGKTLGQGARNLSKNRAIKMTGRIAGSVGKGLASGARTIAMGSLLTVGAVGMLGLGLMNGMNNAAKDIVYERYMSDQRFARDILLQSRLGSTMGTDRMNRYGSTIGLSNSLSRTRHGASY